MSHIYINTSVLLVVMLGSSSIVEEVFVSNTEYSPSFSGSLQNAEVLLGGKTKFECKVKAKPRADVKWYVVPKECKAMHLLIFKRNF